MSILYEADGIRREIESHSHYGPCLNGSRYSNFSDRRNILSKCMDYNKELINLKEEIISEKNKLDITKKKYYQSIEISNKEVKRMENKFKSEEEIR